MSNQYMDIALQYIVDHEVNKVLAKMRTEIEEVPIVKPCPPYINEFAEVEHYNSKSAGMIKDDILKIIDKYIVKE